MSMSLCICITVAYTFREIIEMENDNKLMEVNKLG